MTGGTTPHGPYVVVDASVALKWALDDETAIDCAVALRDDALRGRHTMVAPSLWVYEVANGLRSATRRGRLTADEGARALEHMLGIGVVLADPEPRAVLTTAADLGVSVYDAAYAALAPFEEKVQT